MVISAIKNNKKQELDNNLRLNLAYLIKKYKIDNEILAKCTGLSSATIASLRSRATNPTISTLQPLVEFFNITIDELINQDCQQLDANRSEEANLSTRAKNISIPIISLDRVKDWPYQVTKSPEVQYINTKNDINNNCYALKLDGNVLLPQYKKNTLFIVDPDLEVNDSNLVVVSLNKTPATFRQVFIDSYKYYFKPINPDFGGMEFVENYSVHGVVIRAIYDLVDC